MKMLLRLLVHHGEKVRAAPFLVLPLLSADTYAGHLSVCYGAYDGLEPRDSLVKAIVQDLLIDRGAGKLRRIGLVHRLDGAYIVR